MSGVGRPITANDVELVRQLVAESFDAEILPFMTFGQHGIARFLANSVRFPLLDGRVERVVVDSSRKSGHLAAFADFRLPEPTLGFLSNVCVEPESRGERLTSRLIEDFVASHPELTRVELDMFSDNSTARKIYQSLGFETVRSTSWVARSIGDQLEAADSIAIPGLPSSLAAWDEYGFCELEVLHNGRAFHLGLVGDKLRSRSLRDLEDESLMDAVSAVFGHVQSAFAVIPADETPSPQGSVHVMRSAERMALDLTSSG